MHLWHEYSREVLIAIAITLLLVPLYVSAQQAPATDTVSGLVLTSDSVPIISAQVHLKGDDGRQRETVADSAGHYLLIMPNGVGTYEVGARAFGYSPFSAIVQRVPGSTHIVRNLRLRPRPYVIPTVQITARSKHPLQRTAPSEKSSRWESWLTADLPVDPSSLLDVAAIQEGVVRGASGLSIAGQSPDQNRTTVDGASYKGTNLPAEGVRSTGVITNSYDVARGQFTGGQIMATTLSGTNTWGSAFHVSLDEPALTYGNLPGSLSQSQRSLRFSGGGGGPIIRDRLFVYAALDAGHTRSSSTSLDQLASSAVARLGLPRDSVRRLVDIVRTLDGSSLSASDATESGSDFGSMLARFDYAISAQQSLTARLDWRASSYSGLGASPFNIGTSVDALRSQDRGALLQLTSGWGLLYNELRVYRSTGSTRPDATRAFPYATVQIVDGTDGETSGVPALGFGGLPFTLGELHSQAELADQMVHETRRGIHRIDAGVLIQKQDASLLATANRFGTFTFNSLGDLDAGQPSAFTRNFARDPGSASRTYGATYLGDIWHPREGFQLGYGLRANLNHYGRRADPTSAVTALAPDVRTQIPSDLFVTPRIGFDYSPPSSPWGIDGGVGSFDGTTNITSVASLWDATGTGSTNLVCIGTAAPEPHWSDYRADAATIPSTCSGAASGFASAVPSAVFLLQTSSRRVPGAHR